MKYRFVLFLLLAATPAFAQIGDRPVLVTDVWGNVQQSVLVYRDANVEVYVPDFTTRDWLYSYGAEFRRSGKYFTTMYFYIVSKHVTVRDLMEVDSINKTAQEHADMLGNPETLNLVTDKRPRVKAINNMTRAIRQELAHYDGPMQ